MIKKNISLNRKRGRDFKSWLFCILRQGAASRDSGITDGFLESGYTGNLLNKQTHFQWSDLTVYPFFYHLAVKIIGNLVLSWSGKRNRKSNSEVYPLIAVSPADCVAAIGRISGIVQKDSVRSVCFDEYVIFSVREKVIERIRIRPAVGNDVFV